MTVESFQPVGASLIDRLPPGPLRDRLEKQWQELIEKEDENAGSTDPLSG